MTMAESASLAFLAKRLSLNPRQMPPEERRQSARAVLIARFGGKKPEPTPEQRRKAARQAAVSRSVTPWLKPGASSASRFASVEAETEKRPQK